jgi:hypothetical protein
MLAAAVRGYSFLQRLYFGAENKVLRLKDLIHRFLDLISNGLILCLQI